MTTALAPTPLRSWCNYSHLWIEFTSESGTFTVNADPGNAAAHVEVRSVDGTSDLKTSIDMGVYDQAEKALRSGDKETALRLLLGSFSFLRTF